MTTMRFFMVGSWTEGMLHFEKLAPFIVSHEKATIHATAYKLPIGFPVLINQKQNYIEGQLVELKYDATLLALMDTFHGVKHADPVRGAYIRSKSEITLKNQEVIEAEVYFYNPQKLNSKAVLIRDGQWKKTLEEELPLPLRLTDKQKTYVLKLGAVKGRDIVPINDLVLYRELMKLELIVDKGRRLALSSLGKEVYNHLV
ncbi:MAG: gamma-glutamylcyclotransferase family protein [Pseudobdellovibrio sp.]